MEPDRPDPSTSNQSRQSTQQPPNTNTINPPSFRIQQPRRDTDAMSELDTLRVRAIELKIELRLTKEQLIQAQSGMQYLINCFANQQNRSLVQGVSQDHLALRDRNQQLETELHRIRGQLLVQSKENPWGASPLSSKQGKRGWSGGAEKTRERELVDQVEELKDQRASLLNEVLALLKEDANEYSFKFDDGDPARYKPLEHFRGKAAAAARRDASLLDSNLMGSSKGRGPRFMRESAEGERRVDSPLASRAPIAKQPSIYVKPGDMALLDLDHVEQPAGEPGAARQAFNTQGCATSPARSTLDLEEATGTPCSPLSSANRCPARRSTTPPHLRYRRRQQGWPQDFAHFEHQHLMSNAMFIEEKDWDEYLEFWESLEYEKRFSGRHSKEEWKAFYESKVRPAFLQKMAQRSAPVANEPTAAETAEVVVNTEAIEVDVEVEAAQGSAVPPTEAHSPPAQSRSDQNMVIPTETQDHSSSSPVHDLPHGFDSSETRQLASALFQADREPNKAEVSRQSINLPSESVSDREALQKAHAGQNMGASIVMPAMPSFGSLDTFQEPAADISNMPIPGLAGGWPKPAPRKRSKPTRRTEVGVSEKDPGTWRHLFFALKQTGPKAFVLGRNEKLLRTVLIAGVPVGTTLVEVVEQIRGGKIVSAKFFDTAGMKTEPPVTTNTVVVEFLGSKQAQHFVEHCKKHAMVFGLMNGETQTKADVQLVHTQTVPLPPAMVRDMIKTEYALTRVLFLIFVDFERIPEIEVITREITAFAAKCNYYTIPVQPLRVTIGEDHMLLFEYADVRQAAAALNAIGALEWKLGEISKGFAADPCEEAFEKAEDDQERPIGRGAADREGDGEFVWPGGELEADIEAASR